MLWSLRATLGYLVARLLFRIRAAVQYPPLWQWMQGQYARKAKLGDAQAQSFYGHILLFRGQGPWAKEEGIRLLTQAATSGEPKAAYQLGVLCMKVDDRPVDAVQAQKWFGLAAASGHPAAQARLRQMQASAAH
jgi:TPR repeat protein